MKQSTQKLFESYLEIVNEKDEWYEYTLLTSNGNKLINQIKKSRGIDLKSSKIRKVDGKDEVWVQSVMTASEIKNELDGVIKVVRESINEGDGDSKVENKDELKELAMSMAKKAFGDDLDITKVDSVVKKAIDDNTKDGTTDWEAASGMVITIFSDEEN